MLQKICRIFLTYKPRLLVVYYNLDPSNPTLNLTYIWINLKQNKINANSAMDHYIRRDQTKIINCDSLTTKNFDPKQNWSKI